MTIKLSRYHHRVLTDAADAGGVLTITHKGTLSALKRRGLVEPRTVRVRGRRKPRTEWVLTDLGREAIEHAEVIPDRPRVIWPEVWDRDTVTRGRHYRAQGHTLRRGDIMWRIECPARSEDTPVALVDSLAEAVDVLSHHLYGGLGCTARHRADTAPAVDLDALQARTATAQLELFPTGGDQR
jgi:hypothetical protein